jgi:hypothetical protein
VCPVHRPLLARVSLSSCVVCRVHSLLAHVSCALSMSSCVVRTLGRFLTSLYFTLSLPHISLVLRLSLSLSHTHTPSLSLARSLSLALSLSLHTHTHTHTLPLFRTDVVEMLMAKGGRKLVLAQDTAGDSCLHTAVRANKVTV